MDRIDKFLSNSKDQQTEEPVKVKKVVRKKTQPVETQSNETMEASTTTKKKVFNNTESNKVVSYGAPNKNKIKVQPVSHYETYELEDKPNLPNVKFNKTL